MKHLSRFLLASLFVLSITAVQAQDQNNPWAIGIGVNAVNYYGTGDDTPGMIGNGIAGGEFGDRFFDTDKWNILPSVSRLSVARYIGGGFVFEVAGSVNQIDTFGNQGVDDLSYYAADGMVNYSLRALLNDGWFDPFVGVGGGYTWVDEDGAATTNGTAGFNFWFSDNIALNLQSTYKYAFDDGADSHFQHAAGIKFVFGGKDTDGDGIYDKDDECPETAGLAEFNGCPDTDGDGVPDPKDECPTVAGTAAMNGCPDADGDGIKDSEDECPNEAGPKENKGCPFVDKDGDGVLDKDDQCPDVAGTVANNGCPEPTAEAIKELNEYSKTVLFDLNKATIRSESKESLEAIHDIMHEYSNTVFHIEGHTDSQGSDAYNLNLSKERAASVRDYLVANGIPANRLTSQGYGESQPIASNNTAKGRQDNRRVEISLDKDKEMKAKK